MPFVNKICFFFLFICNDVLKIGFFTIIFIVCCRISDAEWNSLMENSLIPNCNYILKRCLLSQL